MNNKTLYIVIVILLLVVVGGGAYFLGSGNKGGAGPETVAQNQTQPVAATPTPAETAGQVTLSEQPNQAKYNDSSTPSTSSAIPADPHPHLRFRRESCNPILREQLACPDQSWFIRCHFRS